MTAALLMVCAMAGLSAFNAHPDEKDHVGAGQYYMTYWDPPAIGDERARGAYSNYGVSYLNQLDAVYFFAGKFARAVKPLAGEDHLALRCFNVALFGLLAMLCWRLAPGRRVLFLPLLITPQAWYVFSYFNGDALPLALSFVAACQMAGMVDARAGESGDHGGGGRSSSPAAGDGLIRGGSMSWRAARLGLTLGLLAISKQNYYVFLAFLACWWVVLAVMERGALPVGARDFALVIALAVLVFGVRYGAHVWAVGHQPPDMQAKVAEQMAAEEFKPSKNVGGEGFWGARMRDKGVTLAQMFTGEWKWHVFTFRSAFGKYGAMNIEAPLIFYRYAGWAFWAFSASLAGALALSGRIGASSSVMLVVFGCLTVFQSLWHSWTADFQSQGRYLFPILGMMACSMLRFESFGTWWRRLVAGVGCVLFGMSAWSFLAVGLARIAR
jgi:hypothetical protein